MIDVIPLISRKAAARKLRVHQQTVERLIRAGSLTKRGQVGDQVFVDVSEIDQMNTRNLRSIGHDHLLKWLGISRPTLRSLLKKRLFRAIPGEQLPRLRELRFDPDEIEQQLRRIVGHLPICSPRHTQTETLNLSTALSLVNQSGIDMADLLIAVRDGSLACERTNNEMSFANLGFERRAIVELRKLKLAPADKSILSARQAATFLQISPEVLSYIRRSRLLLPINSDESDDFLVWQYRQDEVETFQRSFINTEEAAAIVGITRRQVAARVRAGWLRASSGPNIDGAHTYRFDRLPLIKWRSERMVSQEVREYLGIHRRTLEEWVSQGILVPIPDMPKHPLWFTSQNVQNLNR